MTRKEFSKCCKEIMASAELTEKGKAAAIEHAATKLIEGIIDRFPEIRSIEERGSVIENKYAGRRGRTTYCPECSTWSPKEPPAIEALSQEWVGIKDRKIEELCRKVLTGKAA
jgi:hypothetical protein